MSRQTATGVRARCRRWIERLAVNEKRGAFSASLSFGFGFGFGFYLGFYLGCTAMR
jgi:hypothetical protein